MSFRDVTVVPLAAIAVMVLNVAASFGVVWFYSSFLQPGHPAAFYEAFAVRAAPISSVIVGIPLMFAAGLLIARRRPERRGLFLAAAAAILYVIIDMGVLLLANVGQDVWIWSILSHVTKLLSALAGARYGQIRSTRE